MKQRELSELEPIDGSMSTMRRASLTAGVALALMAALGGFAALGVIKPMITADDAAGTAQQITASASLFRFGIVCLVVVVILDVIVAIALFTVFSRTDPMVAAMAAGFRIAYAAVYLVAISQLVQAVGLLDDPDLAFRAVDAYTTTWDVALIVFGVHLLLLGYLAYRSGYVPKVFGVLLVISGLGYLIDGFATVLGQDDVISIGQFTFVGEVALIFWLLISGRRHDFRGRWRARPNPREGGPDAAKDRAEVTALSSATGATPHLTHAESGTTIVTDCGESPRPGGTSRRRDAPWAPRSTRS